MWSKVVPGFASIVITTPDGGLCAFMGFLGFLGFLGVAALSLLFRLGQQDIAVYCAAQHGSRLQS